jgi:hypothetical protein
MFAGGCDLVGVYVVVQGVVILGNPDCCFWEGQSCLLITVVSPDRDGNCVVDVVDFSNYAFAHNTVCGDPDYDPCFDFDCDCDVDVVDFSTFAQHYNHTGC